MEDNLFEGDDTVRSVNYNAFSYAELFGAVGSGGLPYATVMKILVQIAELAIGVPAGPFHLAMVRQELPTVGVWLEHFPSWYDEPKSASVHVISQNLNQKKLMDRPGSFEQIGDLKYKTIWSETRIIPADLVLSAVEQLLY